MEGAPTPAGNQLTEFETLMCHLERHPQLSSNIANLTILDRAPDRDAFTATMERASLVFPRLRQRIVEGPGPFSTPRWEPDPDFDITRHVTHLKLRRPSRAALHELAVQRALTPFDRSRPLWEFLIIEGLAGGKAAMLQRLHHTLTDGEGGLLVIRFPLPYMLTTVWNDHARYEAYCARLSRCRPPPTPTGGRPWASRSNGPPANSSTSRAALSTRWPTP